METHPENQESTMSPKPIIHSVARNNPKQELISISIACGMILTGMYPLVVFLSTMNNPDLQQTLVAWIASAFTLVWGTLLAGAKVKAKGHQKESIRIFGLVSFFTGILLFSIPLVAAILLASGRGN